MEGHQACFILPSSNTRLHHRPFSPIPHLIMWMEPCLTGSNLWGGKQKDSVKYWCGKHVTLAVPFARRVVSNLQMKSKKDPTHLSADRSLKRLLMIDQGVIFGKYVARSLKNWVTLL